ncbi:hypothetical protein A2892_04800 [Candidatus Woesebacteria bacterium RIFCSPLOWO2_01_FULL_39_10b]|uniref:Phosphoribosyltransferase domain-containing protein n=1 Tax=Candidatus Woesebacteria bacterium RIFCSPLOWO2_01_FULL_39_10b TaxID=1802517 RepID=A0A1F8B8B9_9BACT|nr:MAG: hypothetical protein A2892_04800 [Candidatus Woesebacteria bacterium RIFCSPLOWO2_01_FULL_39_10b]
MPSFEYRPRRESFFEQQFSIDQRDFERNTGLLATELSRLSYSPQRNQFTEVPQTEQRRSIEVLWHAESSTLIVPPPTTGTITIKDLPVMAVPVVGFIDRTQPDVVVGCDRGARIYALAVHSMWGKVQEQRFPTLDGKMHFARLSTSLGLDVTSEALARIMEASTAEVNRQGKRINGKRPRIMFIDDLIASGATREQIMKSLREIGVLPKADISFAVMCGSGADVTGSGRRVSIPWHDNPDVIGVNYTRDGQPIPVRTEEARKVRRQLYRATSELVAKTK